MQTIIMNVTPQMAQAFLNTSERNRKLNSEEIRIMVKDIHEGHWELTGQPIIFDTAGNLIDGHHRLTACVRANTPIKTLAVFGSSASNKIDIGMRRNTMQQLVMSGMIDKSNVLMKPSILKMVNAAIDTHHMGRVTSDEALAYYNKYRKSIDFCGEITRQPHAGNKAILSNPTLLLAVFCAKEYGQEEGLLREWAEVMKTGIYDETLLRDSNVSKSILRCREYLMNTDLAGRKSRDEFLSRCMNSIYKYCRNESITSLRGNMVYDIPTLSTTLAVEDQNHD